MKARLNRPLTPREESILANIERFRYLDTTHVFALLESYGHKANREAYLSLERLIGWKLIKVLPAAHFGRSPVGSDRIYEITDAGLDALHGKALPRAHLFETQHYNEPLHNLNLCLASASFDLACRALGWKLYAWGDILARNTKASHQFDVKLNARDTRTWGTRPDNIFSVETSDDVFCIFLELDLNSHGGSDYRRSYKAYERIIYPGLYKRQLGMTQQAYVLTISTSARHTQNLFGYLPEHNSAFLFKTIPEYGRLKKPPHPALDILKGWQRANQQPAHLGEILGHSTAQKVA